MHLLRKNPGTILLALLWLLAILPASGEEPLSKDEYVRAAVRGAGMLAGQAPAPAPEETAFREEMERRKDAFLADSVSVIHPAMLSDAQIAQAKKNAAETDWGRDWVNSQISAADAFLGQDEGFVEQLLSPLTPWFEYGFTCPNCVGRLSQEGVGSSLVEWSVSEPEIIRCKACGQTYPDAAFEETAPLVCPRMGQTLNFYLNDAQREHSDDRSGAYAWDWVGHPMHMSFSGVVRGAKAGYAIRVSTSLAYAYTFTGDIRYAEGARAVLVRLAECYRQWLYHDYWGGVADCDPLYAAWHDKSLPLFWKRHLAESVFAKDTVERASMLQNYWGAGRYHPSTDGISALDSLCLAYDLTCDARGPDGEVIYSENDRTRIERDLLLEWLFGAEPYLGGPGEALTVNNKAPRLYQAMAAVGKCLGVPGYVDTALRGYEGVRDQSFLFDGFSKESPSYTNMYLSALITVPEMLHGFQWPGDFSKRTGTVDVYESDERLRLMFASVVDQLTGAGEYLPLADTHVHSRPSQSIIDVAVKRYPELRDRLPEPLRKLSASEYTLFNVDASEALDKRTETLPELYYPAWMTAILRHGGGTDASTLALSFSPEGGHRHQDNLSLFYVDRGRDILGDLGYIGDMPMNAWIRSSKSHNLVVVDGEDQDFGGRRPELRMMATSPHVSVVEAASTAYPQCDIYKRTTALIKGPEGQTFVVDIFRVRGGKHHAYRVFSEVAASGSEGELTFTGVDVPDAAPLPDYGASIAREHIYGLQDTRKAVASELPWQAIWSDETAKYRLTMLSRVEAVEASHGPGQETREEAGRRVRYVDAIRMGEDLQSVFVAVHEPDGQDGSFPVRNARLLPLADGDGVAIQLETAWGNYAIFSEFEDPVSEEELLFQGSFGVYCQPASGQTWILGVGAETFQASGTGFDEKTAYWTGTAVSTSADTITTSGPRPGDWPDAAEGVQAYVIVDDGAFTTGFPVRSTTNSSVVTERFPLQEVNTFALPAVRYVELDS